MGMGTLCTGKKAPIYGHGDTLNWQKRPPYPGMWTLCTAKKRPICGHGDTLHWQKGPHIWAWNVKSGFQRMKGNIFASRLPQVRLTAPDVCQSNTMS